MRDGELAQARRVSFTISSSDSQFQSQAQTVVLPRIGADWWNQGRWSRIRKISILATSKLALADPLNASCVRPRLRALHEEDYEGALVAMVDSPKDLVGLDRHSSIVIHGLRLLSYNW